MTMRFKDPRITKQFVGLCKQEGYHGTIKKDGIWDLVTVYIPDRKSRNKLISKWAYISCERK